MTFTVEFHRPTTLENPQPKYEELLKTLHKKIGAEQLNNRIEAISCEWALNSGYYFEVLGNRFIFIHVSLDKRDFLKS